MRVVALILLSSTSCLAGEPTPAALEFFEAKVRPILVENCFACHGEKQQELGLRLDSRAAVVKGSERGPVVALGEPEKSKLIAAVRQSGELKMPKNGKLNPEAIEALSTWVKLGLPYPETNPPSAKVDPRQHWAFQPL